VGSHDLDGALRKVARAEEHLNALTALSDEFFNERELYGLRQERDADDPRWIKYIIAVADNPPPSWGVLLGDVVHNLRSALDHLVWRLVSLTGAEGDRRTQFPIVCYARAWVRAQGRSLRGVHKEHRAFIRALQPFQRSHSQQFHPLAQLAWLSNVDKHRIVHASLVIGGWSSSPTLTLLNVTSADVADFRSVVHRIRPENGTEVARTFFANPRSIAQVEVKGKLTLYPAFGEREVTLGEVESIAAYVSDIVEAFAAAWPSPRVHGEPS